MKGNISPRRSNGCVHCPARPPDRPSVRPAEIESTLRRSSNDGISRRRASPSSPRLCRTRAVPKPVRPAARHRANIDTRQGRGLLGTTENQRGTRVEARLRGPAAEVVMDRRSGAQQYDIEPLCTVRPSLAPHRPRRCYRIVGQILFWIVISSSSISSSSSANASRAVSSFLPFIRRQRGLSSIGIILVPPGIRAVKRRIVARSLARARWVVRRARRVSGTRPCVRSVGRASRRQRSGWIQKRER